MKFKEEDVSSIELKEVIEKCQEYQNGNIDRDTLSKWANENFIIREYIGIHEKHKIIMEICFEYEFNSDVFNDIRILETEKFKFYNCLLNAYTNIIIPTQKEDYENICTLKNLDLLSPILEYYIYQHCSYDYDKLIKMIDNCFNYDNLTNLVELLDNFDKDSLEKATKSNNNLISKLEENKELIKDLKDLSTFEDPGVVEVVKNFKKEVLKKAIQEGETEDHSDNQK